MSNASLRELESDLYFISRKYGRRPDVLGSALDLAPVVAQLLGGLVRSLRNKKDEEDVEEDDED